MSFQWPFRSVGRHVRYPFASLTHWVKRIIFPHRDWAVGLMTTGYTMGTVDLHERPRRLDDEMGRHD